MGHLFSQYCCITTVTNSTTTQFYHYLQQQNYFEIYKCTFSDVWKQPLKLYSWLESCFVSFSSVFWGFVDRLRGVEGVKRVSVQKARESTSWQAPVYTDGAALWINHKTFLSLSKLALLPERTWSSSPRLLSLWLHKKTSAEPVSRSSIAPFTRLTSAWNKRKQTRNTKHQIDSFQWRSSLMKTKKSFSVDLCSFHRSSSGLVLHTKVPFDSFWMSPRVQADETKKRGSVWATLHIHVHQRFLTREKRFSLVGNRDVTSGVCDKWVEIWSF